MFVERALVGYLVAGTHEGWDGRDHGPICYIGDARVVPLARGAGLTAAAAMRVREAQPADVAVGFCFMKRQNGAAMGAARSVDAAGVPVEHGCDYAVHDVIAAPARADGVRLARVEDTDGVADLLARSYAGRLFAPRVDRRREDLGLGLRWDEGRLWVKERGGRIAGVLAARDASHLRRTRVLRRGLAARGLAAAHRWWWAARGAAALPREGEGLRTLTVTHLVAEGDDRAIARDLVAAARTSAAADGIHFVRVGFAEGDPLRAALRGLHGRAQNGALHVFARERSRAQSAAARCARPYVNLLAI
jgi:hypothetical protein